MSSIENLERAKEIVNDPVFEQVFNHLEETYLKELRTADLSDKDGIQLVLYGLHVLEQVKTHLNQVSQGIGLNTETLKKLKDGRRGKR